MKNKTIKKYPQAKLIACEDHKKGCYLDLYEKRRNGKRKEVEHSEEVEAILDFNKKGEIAGIDFPSGISSNTQQEGKK